MNLIEKIVIKFCTLCNVNLVRLAYKGIGISKEYEDLSSGFFQKVLLPYLPNKPKLVFFDVGANVGDVTKLILKSFNNVELHAFEPNSYTFQQLLNNTKGTAVIANNFGLGERIADANIFFYNNDKATGHASIYKDVFELHKSNDIEQQPIKLYTLDHYCQAQNIKHIDFLKIDTEGNDFFVLKGATQMLKNDGIAVIQFEFNEMNVVSRVFLKDYYDLLTDYSFFRVKEDTLFPLGAYETSNEIFRLQNLVAIHTKLLK
jgi:FkbM family methyltransferase